MAMEYCQGKDLFSYLLNVLHGKSYSYLAPDIDRTNFTVKDAR